MTETTSTTTGEERRKLYLKDKAIHSYNYKDINPMLPQYSKSFPPNLRCDSSLLSGRDSHHFFIQKWELVEPAFSNDPLQTNDFIINNPELLKVRSNPKAVLFFIHGYGATSLYTSQLIIKNLCTQNYVVFAMDGYGHGLSDGIHAYIPDFKLYVQDYKTVYDKYATLYKGKKNFLVSVSMGGAVAIFLESLDTKKLYSGSVFISPMIKIAQEMIPNQLVMQIFKVMAFVLPRAKLTPSPNINDLIFNNLEISNIVKEYPLYYSETARLGTSFEILNCTMNCEKLFDKFELPFFLLHGENDVVTCVDGAKIFYKVSGSKDKKMKLYKGQRHALMFEEVAQEAFNDIVNWIDERIN